MLRGIREDSHLGATGEELVGTLSLPQRWRHLSRHDVVQRVQMGSGLEVPQHIGPERDGTLRNYEVNIIFK